MFELFDEFILKYIGMINIHAAKRNRSNTCMFFVVKFNNLIVCFVFQEVLHFHRKKMVQLTK